MERSLNDLTQPCSPPRHTGTWRQSLSHRKVPGICMTPDPCPQQGQRSVRMGEGQCRSYTVGSEGGMASAEQLFKDGRAGLAEFLARI